MVNRDEKAAGMFTSLRFGTPPASIRVTVTAGSVDSRFASTAPAEPPPTIT